MPPKITLKIVEGKLKGKKFQYSERNTCIIGRSKECVPSLPSDTSHRTISRHHCLLDINPPDIRIRDFGSLNGTYVNGEKIGQRDKSDSPKEAAKKSFPEYNLDHGDTFKLGKTVFEVDIFTPILCSDCEDEIPEKKKEQSLVKDDLYLCTDCRKKHDRDREIKKIPKRCIKCGINVEGESGAKRGGEYICSACHANPLQILKNMLKLAGRGTKELKVIRDYKIEKKISQGGMGAVYLARHDKTGERVALKLMLPQVASSNSGRDLFLREVENTKTLIHENIVQLRDSGCFEGTYFFTLEFCNAGSIDVYMNSMKRCLEIDEAIPLILQSLDGLDFAHNAEIPYVRLKDGKYKSGKGLVHRDLSPQNILLTKSGLELTAKVSDFGLAKAFDLAGLSGQTCSGSVMGKPVYMPRQQVINFRFSKPEVDVWAMAATLYNMLTGHFPRNFYENRDPWLTILESKPVPIRERNSKIPTKLAKVIDTALIDDPEIPFKTAKAFKKELEKAV